MGLGFARKDLPIKCDHYWTWITKMKRWKCGKCKLTRKKLP